MSDEHAKLTYLEMVEKLKVEPKLNPNQRRMLISAIKCFVRTFVPCGLTTLVQPAEVSQILKRATAAKAGIKERSFSNMISLLRRAMLLYSIIQQPGRNTGSLSPC